VGDDTEHTIGHIMDGVVASEEWVSEKEEILLVSDDSESTDSAILVLRSIKNVVLGIHDVPVLVEHEF
jgi:hypothetical protein